MNFEKWKKKNTTSLKNKTVLFIGATGSIGFEALKIIASLEADIIIGARNVGKAEDIITKTKELYPDVNISALEVDVSSLKSIDNFIEMLKTKNIHPDIFINNAGVFHLPPLKSKDNLDITFATNTVGCINIVDKMIPLMNKNGLMCVTGSMSYTFYRLDYENLDITDVSPLLKKYGYSKREMMESFLYPKKNTERKDLTFNIIHPGICATELFAKSYSKAFMKLIFPLMKLIFHSPKKASLSLVKGLFEKTRQEEWIGPRGLFQAWGYPKVLHLNKCALKKNKIVYDYYLKTLEDIQK